ncbi:hypothetical protein D3C84_922560 [compost metagenome]
MQADVGIVKQVDQLDDHDRRQPPDLVLAKAVAGHIPTAPLVIDAVGVIARVLTEELQWHSEHRSNFSIIGLVLDIVGNQADEWRHLQPMQRDQRA